MPKSYFRYFWTFSARLSLRMVQATLSKLSFMWSSFSRVRLSWKIGVWLMILSLSVFRLLKPLLFIQNYSSKWLNLQMISRKVLSKANLWVISDNTSRYSRRCQQFFLLSVSRSNLRNVRWKPETDMLGRMRREKPLWNTALIQT